MKPAVQDPERGVVVARDDDQLMVRADTGVEPREESVLGDGGCDDAPSQPVQSFPHALPRLDVPPPVEAIGLAPILLSHRVDVFLGVLERGLVQGSFLRLHRPAEIDDPLVGGAAGDRHTVHPRREHVRVGPTVGIRGLSKSLAGEAPRRKIGVDVVRRLAVEPTLRREFVVRLRETHQRDAHGRIIDHPRLVAPGVEDRAAAGRPLQSTAGRSTPDGVGRD